MKHLYIFILFVSTTLLIGCKKDKAAEIPESIILSKNIDLSSKDSSFVFAFESRSTWTLQASEELDWITCGQINGEPGVNRVSFTTTRNDAQGPRIARYILTRGAKLDTIQIRQIGKSHLSIYPESVIAEAEGHVFRLEVEYNNDYQVFIPDTDKEWITCEPSSTKNLNNDYYTIEIAPILDGFLEFRETYINIVDQESSISMGVKISQYGKPKYTIDLSEYGSLEEALKETNLAYIRTLEVMGSMSDNDYYFIRDNLGHIQTLDLAKVETREIPNNAFYRSDSTITINKIIPPARLISIGENSFRNMIELDSISFTSELREIKNGAFKNSGFTYIYLGEGLAAIPESCFEGCRNLRNVNLAASISVIHDLAFKDCRSLIIDKLPRDLLSIGKSAFTYCASINKLEIPDAVESIGANCFSGCERLFYIDLPVSIDTIPDYCFSNCFGLQEIIIPNHVRHIGYAAFFYCGDIKKVHLPTSLISVAREAFFGCVKIEALNFPSTLKKISRASFMYCRGITELKIPQQVTEIAHSAFYLCDKLTKLELPYNCEIIGEHAFERCFALTEVTIPSSVRLIGANAFTQCMKLSKVNMLPTTPPILLGAEESDTHPFASIANPSTLSVKRESLSAYENHSHWDIFSAITPL